MRALFFKGMMGPTLPCQDGAKASNTLGPIGEDEGFPGLRRHLQRCQLSYSSKPWATANCNFGPSIRETPVITSKATDI